MSNHLTYFVPEEGGGEKAGSTRSSFSESQREGKNLRGILLYPAERSEMGEEKKERENVVTRPPLLTKPLSRKKSVVVGVHFY